MFASRPEHQGLPSPNWRDINQNVSTLLDELEVQQRPISAPPHLDDRWAAQLGQLAGALPDQKLSALADIRLDEDYDRFYQAQIASGKKLPPPLDNRTLYQELSQYQGLAQQGQHISPELAQHLLQQRSSASPAPSNGILAAAGLEGQLERPGSTTGVPPSVLQALSQLSVGRQSPAHSLAQQAALNNQLQVQTVLHHIIPLTSWGVRVLGLLCSHVAFLCHEAGKSVLVMLGSAGWLFRPDSRLCGGWFSSTLIARFM